MKRSISKVLRNLTLGAIAVTFALFFGPQARVGEGNGIGDVNGEELNRAIFGFLRSQLRAEEQQLQEQRMPARTIRTLLEQRVLNQMVELLLLSQEAERLGFVVSNEELRDEICSNQIFQREDGRCDPRLFRRILEANRFPPEQDYFEYLRQQLLIQKLRQYLADPIRVSEATARARLAHDQTTLSLSYVTLPKQPSASEQEVDPETLRSFLAAEPQRIELEYERRKLEFQRPEQVRARQILLTGDQAEAEAKQALERLQKGEDFAKLAAELSKDPGTANAGGDLGFFPRGRLDPALEDPVFAGASGDLVGPIKTDRGYHVLRIEEKREALNQSLDDVREQLAKDLIAQDQAGARAREQAQEIIQQASEPGATLAQVAESRSLTTTSTPPFPTPAQRIPGLPALPGLRQSVLALSQDAPLIREPLDAPDAVYVVALLDRKTPSAESIDAQADAARARLTQLDQTQVLEQLYRRIRKRADDSGGIRLRPEALDR